MERNQPLALSSFVSQSPVVGHSKWHLSWASFSVPQLLCSLFIAGGGQERLLDHLVISRCHHAPDYYDLIMGSGFGPVPEAKDSGLTSNNLSP